MQVEVGLSATPIDLTAIIEATSHPTCGGTALFVGSVRSEAAGAQRDDVHALEYEAHTELAEAKLHEIAEKAGARWGVRVSAVHRVGSCALGESTVVIACAAPHRAEALDACRWIIDTVKAEVPIWKKEIYADGSSWVGAGS